MNDEGDRASAPPRLLRALTEELRESDVPPIAWDDMEARLMAKLERASTLPARAEERASLDEAFDGRAEILVPWDDDPADAEEASAAAFELRAVHPASGAEGALGAEGAGVASAERFSSKRTSAKAEGVNGEGTYREAEAPRPSLAPRPRAPRWGRPGWGVAGWGWAGGLAAVAVAAAWLFMPHFGTTPVVAEPVDLASVAVEPRLGDAFDLAGLRAGDVVEASEGPVTFGRAGVLQWTLSAGGRVRVVSGVGHEERRHVIALESGALDVDVVPLAERKPEDGDTLMGGPRNSIGNGSVDGDRPDPSFERFVVEVGGARIAVHGTAFRVVRSSRGIVLDVVRGAVAVGPLSGGEGSGQLVEAPARAAFELDGSAVRALPALADGGVGKSAPRPASARPPLREVVARSSGDERYAGVAEQLEDATSKVSTPPPSVVGPSGGGSGTPVTEPKRDAAPPVEARGDVAWTADRVRSEVSSCIARAGEKSSDGARVTIASSVIVDVDAAGSTRAVRFDPPIRPDLQACAQPVLHARFPAGTGRLLVPLEVRLGPAR